jgi:hypothetical protein
MGSGVSEFIVQFTHPPFRPSFSLIPSAAMAALAMIGG